MGGVRRLTEGCSLCGDNPATIYADLDVLISYRDQPGEKFRSQLRVCIECSDFLTLSRTSSESEHPPAPVVNIAPRRSPRNSEMARCECGQPSQLMTSQGPKCVRCALG